MSKNPPQKKTPFVVEPLNWVAPNTHHEPANRPNDAEQSKAEKDAKN